MEPPAGHALEGIARGYAGKPVLSQIVIQIQVKFLRDGMSMVILGKAAQQTAVNQVPAKRRGQVLQQTVLILPAKVEIGLIVEGSIPVPHEMVA